MATLHPGLLLKLLHSMNTNAKPTGEHRSPLLQVIGILPTIPQAQNLSTELWTKHGFLVQLSDSKNSTYVALSDRDNDLILSNKMQIGQFVYVERFVFDPGFPIPVAYGIRPGTGKHPLIGAPEGVTVRVSKEKREFVIQPTKDSNESIESIIALLHKQQTKRFESESVENCRKEKENSSKGSNVGVTPKRFASPANGRKEKERDPSPAVGKGKRSASPVPSKCVVPSLAAVKGSEEGRKPAREAAIVVPSRYRQPSPTAGRRAGSPAARRMSLSPARRLSGGGGSRKKSIGGGVGNLKVGEGQFGKSGSGGRKSWEEGEGKENYSGNGKNTPDLYALMRTQVLIHTFLYNL